MEGDAILHDIFARLGELVTLQATTKYENAKATDLQKEVTGHLNDCIAHNGNLDQEIGQLKAQLIDSNNTINTQKELIESLNEEIAVLQDSITHNEFKAQNLTEQHADNISQHTAKIDELNKRVISKQQEINSLLRTRSWIITKPLRFTFRLLRGQH
ncbi:hypothetical protein, partial [Serratia marcescens]